MMDLVAAVDNLLVDGSAGLELHTKRNHLALYYSMQYSYSKALGETLNESDEPRQRAWKLWGGANQEPAPS